MEPIRSVRDFSKKKPDWRDIIEAIDASRYTPMAGNLFSLKFVIVKDKKKIGKLAEFSQQDFISKAQYVVVVCSNPSKTLNAYPDKGEMYLNQQAGAGIQNFLLKLQELGLSTCWIGHFFDEKVKKLLKIPEEVNVEAFFPIGYESEFSKEKGRRKIDMDNILYFDEYENKRMK